MEKQNESVRDRLLARLPQLENLAAYREEVAAGVAKNEKKLRRLKWASRVIWIFAVGFMSFVLFCVLIRGMQWLDTPEGRLCELVAFYGLLCGAVYVVKMFINRSRVEILKEVKQVQLQILGLQASLQKDDKQ